MTAGDGSNLTEAQIHTIRYAAMVIEAYGKGKRQSQAAKDLRALLPQEEPQPDYAGIHDHVGDSDDEATA